MHKRLITTHSVRAALVLAMLAAAAGLWPSAAQAHAPQTPTGDPTVVNDVPLALVPSGVTSYALVAADYKLFWNTAKPICPPNLPQSSAPAAVDAERVSRIATDGSLPRVLYEDLGCGSSLIQSNIAADHDYIYWTGPGGLMRLSVNANPGDHPELVNGLLPGHAEVAVDDTNIFVLAFDSPNANQVYRVDKSSKAAIFLSNSGSNASNLQTSYSFFAGTQRYFVYWLAGGLLQRVNVDAPGAPATLASGVTGYYAEGGRIVCGGNICFNNDNVFYGQGTQAYRYSNLNGSVAGPIYISTDATASVISLTGDDNNLFIFERRDAVCSPFICSDYALLRSGRSNDAGKVIIYHTGALSGFLGADRLKTDGTFLFWQENQNGSLQRLPNDASALPQVNLRITGLSITQGIQNPANTVRLIENKRTFVRVFVKSDGAAVGGVTALLDGFAGVGGSSLGTLLPENGSGTKITVWNNPRRTVVDESFLFELPWSWTTAGPLTLVAHLNPYRSKLEPDYTDDDLTAGAFNFSPSGRLPVIFVAWGYSLNNTTYYPRPDKDINQAFSWIRRAYPLSSVPGSIADTSPGFRPTVWTLFDAGLGTHVNQTHADCAKLLVKNNDGTVKSDDRNLCASEYTNKLMTALRYFYHLPDSLFMYGMITDAGGIFPRGQACCGPSVSTGPAGSGTYGWDMDGSYADWYAAHEIGHTLGRAHPNPNSDDPSTEKVTEGCGHSRSDPNFPYPLAHIGPADDTEGFDAGDPLFGIARAVYPGTQWSDVMSYCSNQWISDYTYEGMYNYLSTHPAAPESQTAALAQPNLNGNWLLAQGTIISGTATASLAYLRRSNAVDSVPPLVPGAFSLQLVGAGNNSLASYAFTPAASAEEPDLLSFTQVVTFVPGTTQVRVVRNADNAVLASAAVSAHAPTVGNVALQGAPNPVTGTVTLGWTAVDIDGDALRFDVFYSLDGGATLQPLQLDLAGSSVAIDTSRLGGGTALLRVVANDGVNTAQADSAPFTMANKPPQPRILTPNDGLQRQYGQLVNFSGEADDAQDGSVAPANLSWADQKGALGTGALISVSDLPVSTDVITLTATNSKGLSASTSITVIVGDNLAPPGPTLAVGPSQLAWSFAAGATTPMTGTLNIGNAGGGTLDWTAASGAPWLSLSATSGIAPASLTVTADPTGIASGSALTTQVTITTPAVGNQPAQVVTIPVGIAVGQAFSHPDQYQPSYVYLPLLSR